MNNSIGWSTHSHGRIVKVNQILPTANSISSLKVPKLIAGISLGNPSFLGNSLLAYLQWLREHAERIRIIIGDSLHRFNIAMEYSISESISTEIAMRIGTTKTHEIYSALNSFGSEGIEIESWSEVASGHEFESAMSQIIDLWESDAQFSKSVRRDAFTFVKRRTKAGHLAVSESIAVDLSVSYILEELAVFTTLADDGWIVEAYPGPELGVLSEVFEGQHVAVPDGLKKRINIEVQIRTDHTDGESVRRIPL